MRVQIHIALTKDAYATPAALAGAIVQLADAGVADLQTQYAARIGVLHGTVDEHRVDRIEALPVVEALTRQSVMGIRSPAEPLADPTGLSETKA